jgi:hypothetical protein
MTHQEYFLKNKISLEQFGVLLVGLAFQGKNTSHGTKGYDVIDARIGKDTGCRIEVKTKITKGASVIHCNDNKVKLMTHLAVVLIDGDTYEVEEAWLITNSIADSLRRKQTKSGYISVRELKNYSEKLNIQNDLSSAAKSLI